MTFNQLEPFVMGSMTAKAVEKKEIEIKKRSLRPKICWLWQDERKVSNVTKKVIFDSMESEYDDDLWNNYAPVVNTDTTRLVFSIIATYDMDI